jgi:hypothetical protein
MDDERAAPYTRYKAKSRVSRIRLGALGAAVFAVLVYGSYVNHWSWAGINGHTAKLWDWLHLLLLPFVLAFLPIWLSRTTRVSARRKRIGLTACAVFAVVVLLGYTVPWVWTGFRGNTLWDWLGLIALPVAVALAPVVDDLRKRWNPRHTLILLAGCGAFAAIVVGGYLGDWKWTGFRHNTVWDWLRLMLLPLLIPTVVVPALRPLAMSGVAVLNDGDDASEHSDIATGDQAGGSAEGRLTAEV